MSRLMTSVIMAIALGGVASAVGARQDDARLGPLFQRLADTTDAAQAREAEANIWAIWIDSGREDVNRLMSNGIEALRMRMFDAALEAFSKVIVLDPGFAEGWNKRATVLWLMDRNDQSMEDIRHTLSLEPRHFGAISGMGLIFMESGDNADALEAFEQVLKINPNARGAQVRVEQLRAIMQKDAI